MTRKRERGVVLLAMLAVIALLASYFLVSRLNAESGGVAAANRIRNAAVLIQAKQALIGYVAMTAATAGETNPGRLPCPEHAWYIGIPDKEGIRGPSVGVSSPGFGSPDCTSIGRLPWRTLGLDKLVDAAGEPLWYVVGPVWRLTSSTSTLQINSDTAGDVLVDGQQVVALIIAPGAPMNVQASPGCVARNQSRGAPAPTMDARDYLECFDTATLQFVATAPSTSLNDQVLRITTADVLPAIEAAIANRIEREISPLIRDAYSTGSWSATTVLPFAATFADPSLITTTFKGISGTNQGLLPLSYSETSPTSGVQCTPGASEPRCDPMFVAWTGVPVLSNRGGGAGLYFSSCSVNTVTVNPAPLVQTTRIDCTFRAYSWSLDFWTPDPLQFRLAGSASNVGMALRQFNTAAGMAGVDAAGRTASGTLNGDGSAAVTLDGAATVVSGNVVADTLCGLPPIMQLLFDCYESTISVPITLLADHTVLDSTSTGANPGWFMRNKWHEVAYYAVAPDVAPSGTRSCVTGTTCLNVGYHPNDGKQRGIILLSGRTLSGAARPNGILADWLEGANADGTSPFEIRAPTLLVNRSFNDRVAVLDSNP